MRHPSRSSLLALTGVLFLAASASEPRVTRTASAPDLETAPRPSTRLLVEGVPPQLATGIDSWFAGHGTRRVHIQLDRPLYRPGESVWIKTWNVSSRAFGGEGAGEGLTYELVDPQGLVVETKDVLQEGGTATNDFVLSPDAPGGQWTLRARLGTGEQDERPFVVASYSTPRVHKTLDFIREAYGPGDDVEALVVLQRGTGEALADHPVRMLLQVDGQTVVERALRTDATGAVFVRGALPASLASGDSLLTVLVEEGGFTESISRSVPIVLSDLNLTFFPEGGELVSGLPGRVYFEGQDRHGEPADVAGWIEDDRGQRVATFSSVHDGMGRTGFTPQRGRRYVARVSAPAGVEGGFTLPEARESGCTLRSFDDLRGEVPEVRVAVRCSSRQDVFVAAVVREQTADVAGVRAGPDEDAVVYLDPGPALAEVQGAMRVTVFDPSLAPLAERLIYRNHGKDLRLAISTDREAYGPRDEVVLDVKATSPSGQPVAAELALTVVDDAVLGLADDEEGHMLTRLYLEPELVESPEDPAWYFDPEEPQAARGVDLVMGTRGWRRFEWHRVWEPEEELSVVVPEGGEVALFAARIPRRMEVPPGGPPPMIGAPRVDAPAEPMAVADDRARQLGPAPALAGALALQKAAGRGRGQGVGMAAREEAWDERGDLDWIGYVDEGERVAWAPVRVFPRPDHQAGFSGVRTDFRDTVHWEPTVHTAADGTAQVRFHLSDAITSFRVTAEGLGAGLAGHSELTLTSVLPVSLATRLPAAVSSGDRLMLPLTVRNTRAESLLVALSASSDSLLMAFGQQDGTLRIGPDGTDTWWVPMQIGAGSALGRLRLVAEGGGGQDVVEQALRVVPAGFPRTWSAAGEQAGAPVELRFTIDDLVPGSLAARVTWHPSTMATLISGLDGLIQSPGGCFEQTSSTNWPNVAILNYLEAHDGDPRVRARSAQALQAGYDKLTGYQVDEGGFETWGSGPGKEALSAFGLLQFADMKKVYPVDDAILSRDAGYLLAQKDGKGGFHNSGESAHGYGSAPQAVLDGFITWALVATGHHEALRAELGRQGEVARASKDPYVLALAARSLVATHDPGAARAIERLVALQAADGSFPGAESSITRSYEANLLVESTALAALALMESGGRRAESDRAASWLVANRQGGGTWGATQATALALGALTAHADLNRGPRSSGELRVDVNGVMVGTLAYSADQVEPLEIGLPGLVKGENVVRLWHPSGEPLPYTVDVGWTALNPASAPGAELGLDTSLDRAGARMGETVRLIARIDNRTGAVVPSPIARVGLPAGLEAQTWQLQELQDRGEIAFFETRPREVTLYWDGLHAGAGHQVKLDLVAAVPGAFTGPASSAWPYYDDDEKAWDAGLRVVIEP